MCLNKKEMDESRRKFVDKKENSQLVSVNFQLGGSFAEDKVDCDGKYSLHSYHVGRVSSFHNMLWVKISICWH